MPRPTDPAPGWVLLVLVLFGLNGLLVADELPERSAQTAAVSERVGSQAAGGVRMASRRATRMAATGSRQTASAP